MSDPDDDTLDGCELDFAAEAVDDETAEMLPLFPLGTSGGALYLERKAAEWRELFGGV